LNSYDAKLLINSNEIDHLNRILFGGFLNGMVSSLVSCKGCNDAIHSSILRETALWRIDSTWNPSKYLCESTHSKWSKKKKIIEYYFFNLKNSEIHSFKRNIVDTIHIRLDIGLEWMFMIPTRFQTLHHWNLEWWLPSNQGCIFL
jgi:hypothetical protein